MKMSSSNQLELLKLVNNKLEAKRDELMDVINVSLSSVLPNRVQVIYDTQLELATIEKAMEINRYFQIQIQEQILSSMLENTEQKDSEDNFKSDYPEDDEDLKK